MITDESFLINAMSFLNAEEKRRLKTEGFLYDEILALSAGDLRTMFPRINPRSDLWPSEIRRRSEFALKNWEAFPCSVVEYGEAAYPIQLSRIGDPPFLLYYRGFLPHELRLLVAVVGTRMPSERGRKAAWRLGLECAHLGIGLVSGLASGIDGAAQAGCVEQRGYTIAVIATGVDSIHPRIHTGLAARLLDAGGCIVSEYGPGIEARRFHFPERNRIISGLSRATIVVEAPERSGALITARYALEQDRDVWVHAEGQAGERGRGCAILAEQGAGVLRHMEEIASDDSCIDTRF